MTELSKYMQNFFYFFENKIKQIFFMMSTNYDLLKLPWWIVVRLGCQCNRWYRQPSVVVFQWCLLVQQPPSCWLLILVFRPLGQHESYRLWNRQMQSDGLAWIHHLLGMTIGAVINNPRKWHVVPKESQNVIQKNPENVCVAPSRQYAKPD